MNSQLWVTLGASCLSLVSGYFIGNFQGSSEGPGSALTSQNSHSSGHSISGRQSDSLSSSKYATRPTSAQGRAEFAVHHARAKLEESGNMMMDFGIFADVWNTLDDLSAEELQLALTALEDEPAMNQSAMMLRMMLLSQWGEVGGQAAAEYALSQQKGGMMRGMGLMGCMSSWIKVDPIAAEAWYEKNKDSFKGGMFSNGNIKSMFVRGLAKRDINAAFKKIDMSNTSERNAAVQTMAHLVAEDDMRSQVIEKVQSLEDAQLKHKMLNRMMSTLSYQDLDAANELLNQLKDSDPKEFKEYQSSLLNGMRMIDPKAALEYAETEISDEKSRNQSLKSSFAQYAANDEAAAQEWLDSQSFENKDQFYQRASSNQRWQNPDKSMEWALKISDDDKRTDEVISVYERWKEEHSAGAEAWLGQLDEESQAAILEGVDKD